MIFLSTTYYGKNRSILSETLNDIELNQYDIDGIELGSTHIYEPEFNKIVGNVSKEIITHNFFPPDREDENFVINIASNNDQVRRKSLEIVKKNINFALEVNSKYYTIHPGYLSDGKEHSSYLNYDFIFKKQNKTHYNIAFDNLKKSLEEIFLYLDGKKIKLLLETEGSINNKDYLILQEPREYENLLNSFGKNIGFNFNIAHSYLAAKCFDFSLIDLIKLINKQIYLIELSHNDCSGDQHLPLTKDSYIFDYIKYIDCDRYILEFRNASSHDIKSSIKLLKIFLDK